MAVADLPPRGTELWLAYQLRVIPALMGYTYGAPDLHEWVIRQLAAVLYAAGLRDVREIGARDASLTCQSYGADESGNTVALDSKTLAYREWFNTATGASLSGRLASVAGVKYEVAGVVQRMNASACSYRGVCNMQGDAILCGADYVTLPTAVQDHLLFRTIGRYANDGRDTSVVVFVKFTDGGVPYFLIGRKPHREGKEFVKEFLTMAALLVVSVVPGVGQAIGGAVMGSYAAAYPALAQALGNVALQTALNGGDVEAAIERAAASYVGAGAGSYVQGVSDSAALARLTSVATSAAVRGESVSDAIDAAALNLLPVAAGEVSSAVVDVFSSDAIPAGDAAMSDFDFDSFDFSQGGIDASGAGDFDFGDFDVSSAPVFDFGAVPMEPGVIDLDAAPLDMFAGGTPFFDETGFNDTGFDTSSPFDIPAEAPASSFFNDITFDDVVDGITDVVAAAVRINDAYQRARNPPVQPGAQRTAGGATQTARSDGTLTSTDPVTGRAVVTRPVAGVPYQTADGGVVLNNGNGTYTRIAPDGTTRVMPYPSSTPQVGTAVAAPTWIPGVPNVATLGLAALVGFALLSRR